MEDNKKEDNPIKPIKPIKPVESDPKPEKDKKINFDHKEEEIGRDEPKRDNDIPPRLSLSISGDDEDDEDPDEEDFSGDGEDETSPLEVPPLDELVHEIQSNVQASRFIMVLLGEMRDALYDLNVTAEEMKKIMKGIKKKLSENS